MIVLRSTESKIYRSTVKVFNFSEKTLVTSNPAFHKQNFQRVFQKIFTFFKRTFFAVDGILIPT